VKLASVLTYHSPAGEEMRKKPQAKASMVAEGTRLSKVY